VAGFRQIVDILRVDYRSVRKGGDHRLETAGRRCPEEGFIDFPGGQKIHGAIREPVVTGRWPTTWSASERQS
jgi:hypothetical protein